MEFDLTPEEEEAFLALEKKQEETRNQINTQIKTLVSTTAAWFNEVVDISMEEYEVIELLKNSEELQEILAKVTKSKALQYGLERYR